MIIPYKCIAQNVCMSFWHNNFICRDMLHMTVIVYLFYLNSIVVFTSKELIKHST